MLKSHPKNLGTLSSLLTHSLINSAHSLKDFLEYSWILFFQRIFFLSKIKFQQQPKKRNELVPPCHLTHNGADLHTQLVSWLCRDSMRVTDNTSFSHFKSSFSSVIQSQGPQLSSKHLPFLDSTARHSFWFSILLYNLLCSHLSEVVYSESTCWKSTLSRQICQKLLANSSLSCAWMAFTDGFTCWWSKYVIHYIWEKCILMCIASSLGRNVFICILQEANGHALQIWIFHLEGWPWCCWLGFISLRSAS